MDSVQYGDFVSVLGHRKSPMMMQAESSLSKKPLGMRRSDGYSSLKDKKMARYSATRRSPLKPSKEGQYTGGPLLTLFFETLKKQPCKQKTM